jgi:hypothetical protein
MDTYLFTKYAGRLEARGAWSSMSNGMRPPGDDFVSGVSYCAAQGLELVTAFPSSPGTWAVIFRQTVAEQAAAGQAVDPQAAPAQAVAVQALAAQAVGQQAVAEQLIAEQAIDQLLATPAEQQ